MSGKMRCPFCGSSEVSCTSTRREHRHECRSCGYSTIAAAVKR